MLAKTARGVVTPPFYYKDVVQQFDAIGIGSLTVVLLTGTFTGMVLALQSGITLDQFGARSMVGRLVSASIVKELGPVLTGLMVAGRVGSGIAAELGSMMVTDQIAALRALGTDPVRKLVVPRDSRRPGHGAGADRHLERCRHGRRLDRDRRRAARRLVGLLELGRPGPLHPGRLDGPDQAVLPRLRHRQHRLPRRAAHQGRDAGRRPLDHQRRGGELGGGDCRRLSRDSAPHRA